MRPAKFKIYWSAGGSILTAGLIPLMGIKRPVPVRAERARELLDFYRGEALAHPQGSEERAHCECCVRELLDALADQSNWRRAA